MFKRIREAIFGRPIIIDDPVFGEIQYYPNRKWQDCSFWAARFSAIANAEVGTIASPDELLVYAEEDGPSDRQREVFLDFEEHLPQIQSDLRTRMFEDNQKWSELAKLDVGPPVHQPFPLAEDESHAYEMAYFSRIEVFADSGQRACDIGLYVCIPWEVEHNRYVTIADGQVTDYFAE